MTEQPESSEQTQPFKPFWTDNDDIFKIPAPAFQLWMAFYRYERETRAAYPTAAMLCEMLDCNAGTVAKWKHWLLEHCWLTCLHPAGRTAYAGRAGTWHPGMYRVTRPEGWPPRKTHFERFYVGGDYDRVFRLPAGAFKVWVYYFSRKRKLRKTWPTISKVAEVLSLHRNQVARAKQFLIDNGWLQAVPTLSDGQVSPHGVFKATLGTIPPKQDGRGNDMTRARAVRDRNAREAVLITAPILRHTTMH